MLRILNLAVLPHDDAIPAYEIAFCCPRGCADGDQASDIELVSSREGKVTLLAS
jgi:hypothetical protein